MRVIHSGYDRTVPRCRVMPAEIERDIIEEDTDDKHDDQTTKEASNEKEKKEPNENTLGTEKEASNEDSKYTINKTLS